MSEEKKDKTRIDFTLMEYTSFSYIKGKRKRSFFLEDLKNLDFSTETNKEGEDYFGILVRGTKEGWIYVIENPWEVLNPKLTEGGNP